MPMMDRGNGLPVSAKRIATDCLPLASTHSSASSRPFDRSNHSVTRLVFQSFLLYSLRVIGSGPDRVAEVW
jgi:hypothetical protein